MHGCCLFLYTETKFRNYCILQNSDIYVGNAKFKNYKLTRKYSNYGHATDKTLLTSEYG